MPPGIAAMIDRMRSALMALQADESGATAIEAHARLFNYPAVSATRSMEDANALGFKAIFFSNSFGAYRKCALEKVGGFPRQSNFGEDTVVAARLLQSGWRVAYVADALAHHSHAYSHVEEFRRYYKIGQLHGSEPWLLRDFGKASPEGRKFATSEIQYLLSHGPRLIPDAIFRSGLKYMAYRFGRFNSGD